MDRNDAKDLIPTIRPGDRVGIDYFNSISSAINQRRGGVNPPSQKFTTTAAGGGGGDVLTVDYASTANIASLNTNPTIDGNSWTDGAIVLVWKQTTSADNGVYTVKPAGTAWVLVSPQPYCVNVLLGTANGQLAFYNITTTTWSANYGTYAA